MGVGNLIRVNEGGDVVEEGLDKGWGEYVSLVMWRGWD